MKEGHSEILNQVTEILRIATSPLTAADVVSLVNDRYDAELDIGQINTRLKWLIQKGKAQRHHNPSGVLRYSLIGTKAALVQSENPIKPEPKGKRESTTRPGDAQVKSFEDAVRHGRVIGPCGLKDRLKSIASDINDAVTDACDLKLDHEVIKTLLASQAACNTALQRL